MQKGQLMHLMNSIIENQREQLAITINNLPLDTTGKGNITRSSRKLANDLRAKQLAKEEGMRDLLDAIMAEFNEG